MRMHAGNVFRLDTDGNRNTEFRPSYSKTTTERHAAKFPARQNKPADYHAA